jgi:signal transduction histidine kinase
VVVEAFWNVAKHSGARNMYLESRRWATCYCFASATTVAASTRPIPPGMGLRYLRERAGEVGAKLDVISAPGRGTNVQLRFRTRKNPPDPELSGD